MINDPQKANGKIVELTNWNVKSLVPLYFKTNNHETRKPGKQGNNSVNVQYGIPIIFKVSN